MPVPAPGRWPELARKGGELALRQVAMAPEQRAARRLAAAVAAEAPPLRPGAPRVLFLTPRDWAVHVQCEAMIAHGLRLRGADVRFLACGGGLEICDRANTYESPPMPCATCTRYVEGSLGAHGFERSSLRAGWEADDPVPWPELDEVPARDLLDVEADGLPLGRLVEIPLKWFLCAASLDHEPLAGLVTRAFLRSVRRIARGVRRALDDVAPRTVVLLNGLFVFEAVAWELCRQRGVDVVTYERAFLEGTLVLSRGEPAGLYDQSRAWPAEDRPLAPEEDAQLDAYLARRRAGAASDQFWRFQGGGGPSPAVAGAGRLAVLFTNLTWDTAVIGRDVAFPDIRRWLDEVVGWFGGHPEHRLVIRVHPSEVRLPGKATRDSLEAYLRAAHLDLPPNVTVVGAADLASSYELVDACDVGLVYTSTTGLELALAGKPVVVAGAVHYRGKGFTVDVSGPGQFRTALEAGLADPASLPTDMERARRYAHFFWFRAPVPVPYVAEPLPGLARILTDRPDDLRPGRHEGLDRICDFVLGAGPGTPVTPSRTAPT